MINVQPYIDKLDKLKEYMNLLIDGKVGSFIIDFTALPVLPWEEIVRIYQGTGMMFTRLYESETREVRTNFEEWYQLQIDGNKLSQPI